MLVRYVFAAAVILLMFTIFFFTKGETINVTLFPLTDSREMPTHAAMWVFFIYGFLAAFIASQLDLFRMRKDNRALKKEKETLEKEVAALRDLMVTEPEE
ncbi:lipopolysaccharide assembly protein LapA domain-containing protein [Acanthopleuribacter pedis]|uniref:DUF1049 domain-containing protein n=1 Tax=Acanthopleuribacter pedis TaxID=442870 RepID=A0A8J7U3N2_9BACT|nr:lipopolysaccharide assembly protein LapA domain-containing protein [Acanthopleuribacter pedis]MBO1319787.1 DUF1049 domain-containing protein [Acanthopleuribacter pedis]